MLQCCCHCGNWQLGTGSLIAAQALTSLWRWQDLICLAHNLSKSPRHPLPSTRQMSRHCCNDCWCLRARLHAACCLIPGVPKLSSVACSLLALDCRLSCAADSAHPKLRPRWHVALGSCPSSCQHPYSHAMSLFDVGRLSFNLTGLWFACFCFLFFLAWVCLCHATAKKKKRYVCLLVPSPGSLTLPPLVAAVYPHPSHH